MPLPIRDADWPICRIVLSAHPPSPRSRCWAQRNALTIRHRRKNSGYVRERYLHPLTGRFTDIRSVWRRRWQAVAGSTYTPRNEHRAPQSGLRPPVHFKWPDTELRRTTSHTSTHLHTPLVPRHTTTRSHTQASLMSQLGVT